MDTSPDPLLNFFTSKESKTPDILYKTLSATSKATNEELKKAYKKACLRCHPDKHSGKSVEVREEMGKEFQRVGFAWAVLGDEGRRKRYDATGRTDDVSFGDAEEMGWDAYFESMYQRVDRKMLDDHKKEYQGSKEEESDLISAYTSTSGHLPKILTHIPHSTINDEQRFIHQINQLISTSTIPLLPNWQSTSTDIKAAEKRKKKAEKEEKVAEDTARELGVWDEFYGDGKKGARQGGKGKGDGEGEGGGEGGLAGVIAKRQRDREGGIDALEAKYRGIEEEKKKRRKGKGKLVKDDEGEGMPIQEISDADFEALQAKMFAKKDDQPKSKKSKA